MLKQAVEIRQKYVTGRWAEYSRTKAWDLEKPDYANLPVGIPDDDAFSARFVEGCLEIKRGGNVLHPAMVAKVQRLLTLSFIPSRSSNHSLFFFLHLDVCS